MQATHEHGTCASCGDAFPAPPAFGGAAGYATIDGTRICYPCATVREREDMRASDRYCGYVSADWRTVTTWTGGMLGTVVRKGARHPWSGHGEYASRYVTVRDWTGATWHGVGAPGALCRLRRAGRASR